MEATAVIVAAGKGLRMKKEVRKQYLLLADRPILAHTLKAFDDCPLIGCTILVIPPDDIEECERSILSPLTLKKPIDLVSGGQTRQDSVFNGLKQVKNQNGIVVIHDGVRPFVCLEKLMACIKEAKNSGACLLGIPAVDTLKRVNDDGYITNTLDRSGIWHAHTPQVFKYKLIREAHDQAKRNRFIGTDDVGLLEQLNVKVQIKMIKDSKYNIKITTPDDLILGEAIHNCL